MIKQSKPTSAGRRFHKGLVRVLTKKSPEKSLLAPLKGHAGRNNGRISSRFRERGTKKYYRIIDFKRNKHDIPAKVAAIEYDPCRGPNIALLHYVDGEKRYILAPDGLKPGMQVISGENVDVEVGNSLPIEKIPLGTEIHNIELNPGRGGQMARSAGNYAKILAKEGKYANIKLPSGLVRKVLIKCYASIGILSNSDLKNSCLGKAGLNRYKGRRPHVRGVAMANPTDHPHAGSYRDNGIGMPSPKSPWGWKTRGKKTRRRSYTDKYIVQKSKK